VASKKIEMIEEIAYRPKYPLSKFVDYIWVGKSPDLTMDFVHHAALFTELIFSYGDEYDIKGINTERIEGRTGLQLLSGLKNRPFVTNVNGTYACIGLILKPFCYGILLQKLGSSSLEEVAAVLFDSLFVTENPDFVRAENCLLKIFETVFIDPHLMRFEAYLSAEMAGRGMLNDFSRLLPISQKSFIQKFKKYYVLTPNEYLNLYKVNKAVMLLQGNSSERLTDIGLNAGFYDQSHFIRVFKKFSGYTPKEFSKFGIR
jgi:AraC-like DNA-binding protein